MVDIRKESELNAPLTVFNKCCCCASLRQGVLVISSLDFLVYVLSLTVNFGIVGDLGYRAMGTAGTVLTGIIIAAALSGFVGAWRFKTPLVMIFMCGLVIILFARIVDTVLITVDGDLRQKAIDLCGSEDDAVCIQAYQLTFYVSSGIYTVFNLYFLLVTRSFILQLRDTFANPSEAALASSSAGWKHVDRDKLPETIPFASTAIGDPAGSRPLYSTGGESDSNYESDSKSPLRGDPPTGEGAPTEGYHPAAGTRDDPHLTYQSGAGAMGTYARLSSSNASWSSTPTPSAPPAPPSFDDVKYLKS